MCYQAVEKREGPLLSRGLWDCYKLEEDPREGGGGDKCVGQVNLVEDTAGTHSSASLRCHPAEAPSALATRLASTEKKTGKWNCLLHMELEQSLWAWSSSTPCAQKNFEFAALFERAKVGLLGLILLSRRWDLVSSDSAIPGPPGKVTSAWMVLQESIRVPSKWYAGKSLSQGLLLGTQHKVYICLVQIESPWGSEWLQQTVYLLWVSVEPFVKGRSLSVLTPCNLLRWQSDRTWGGLAVFRICCQGKRRRKLLMVGINKYLFTEWLN